MKKLTVILTVLSAVMAISCNNGLMGGEEGGKRKEKVKEGIRGAVDASEYVDFTMEKYDAVTWKKDDVMYELGGKTYKNGNSSIKINRIERTAEITSDNAYFNGKKGCQLYAKYGIELLGAGSDCLYIRKDARKEGMMIIDNMTFKNDQIPDLTACIPLYGYSKNRIEVSPVMNGHIAMPSGTYWSK